MSIKSRLKILQKIAQTTPAAPTTNTISGSPAEVSVASIFPTIVKAWGASNIPIIQNIINALNWSIYMLSQGQIDFNKLRLINFIVDESKYPDRVLVSVVKLSKLIYNQMLSDNGAPFKDTFNDVTKKDKIDQLKQVVNIGNIPDTTSNPNLANKIGGNIKTVIFNYLNTIK